MMVLASKVIYFLKSIPEDEDPLFSLLSVIVPVISYSHIWIKSEKEFYNKLGKKFLNNNPIFLGYVT